MESSRFMGRGPVRWLAIGGTALALALSGCAAGQGGSNTGNASATAQVSEPSMAFVGPNGEKPDKIADLVLTAKEKAEVKSGGYKAAFVWHTSSEFVSAVEKGAREEFKELGIDVVASTQANFDAATQANNLQTVLALNPDIVVTIAVDPV